MYLRLVIALISLVSLQQNTTVYNVKSLRDCSTNRKI